MVCRKCGKKIEGDRLFCPACGTEVQMVPEYGHLEDELHNSMKYLKEETKQEQVKEMKTGQPYALNPEKPYARNDWEEFSLEKKVTAGQKKARLIAAIAALSVGIVAVIIGIICFIVFSVNKNSFDRQMEQGEKYWKSGNYESAVTAFENAVNESEAAEEKADALSKLAGLYVEYGDENSAIYYYEEAAERNLLSNEDVSTLVGLYENKADMTAIRKLAEKYSNEETEDLFEKHLLNQPVFNYKSGTYNEELMVEITAANNEQIFYTLDNTEATTQSTQYTGVLQIGEGKTVVRAVAVNVNGLVSDEIITTYEVKLDVPVTPIITPDTGSYAESTKISIHNIPTNCKAYYTIDGTTPTLDSVEYTEPFDMMPGNSVVMAVCINQYTGQSSQTAMKIFDLSISGKISYAQAPACVINRLQELGEVLDGNGTMANGEVCNLQTATVRKIGGNSYYIVKRYNHTSGGLKEQGTAYAVDINTGAVFRAADNGNGEYNLSGL